MGRSRRDMGVSTTLLDPNDDLLAVALSGPPTDRFR
jgi:hypothetical protein